MEIRETKQYTLVLTEKEYYLFYNGIGNTSREGRKAAGMSEAQAEFFAILFGNLPDPEENKYGPRT